MITGAALMVEALEEPRASRGSVAVVFRLWVALQSSASLLRLPFPSGWLVSVSIGRTGFTLKGLPPSAGLCVAVAELRTPVTMPPDTLASHRSRQLHNCQGKGRHGAPIIHFFIAKYVNKTNIQQSSETHQDQELFQPQNFPVCSPPSHSYPIHSPTHPATDQGCTKTQECWARSLAS